MYSPSKHEDKMLLLEIGEMIETLVKHSNYDLAGKFGEDYEQLEQKIKTHDYSNDDEILNRSERRLLDFQKGITV